MTCEEVLELLPDHVLGTLSETEDASIRRHLRGCGACRADAVALDRGVAMFSSAAHAVDPPVELRERVLTTLSEEWADPAPAGGSSGRRPGSTARWLAVAAAVVLVAALAWGSVAQANANRASSSLAAVQGDAHSYRDFLHALGGKEVRVAELHPVGSASVSGTAILYDSDRHQSWVLVEVDAPGLTRSVAVMLRSPSGQRIDLPFPIQIAPDGNGAGWLVTAADISAYTTVVLTDPSGHVLATGQTPPSG